MAETMEILQPDDWHLHLRDGEALNTTVPATARIFARAIVMPNLVPPVTTTKNARQYRQRILEAAPAGSSFEPLMTLYLTDNTSIKDIKEAKASGLVTACKLYPAGATTNSASGVTDINGIAPALATMQEVNMPLLIHGEVVAADVDIFDREKVFIDQILSPLTERFPTLRIVLEHITTKDAAIFVQQASTHIAATITAHHLLCNRNDMLVGGIRPHYYCLPILKRSLHQQALQDAVVSGSEKFFLGTDSAPHSQDKKEAACGCAGCYTAPVALPLYTEAFEQLGALDKLEAFTSINGANFYELPLNTRKVRLYKEQSTIPKSLPYTDTQIIPFRAGEAVQWQAELV